VWRRDPGAYPGRVLRPGWACRFLLSVARSVLPWDPADQTKPIHLKFPMSSHSVRLLKSYTGQLPCYPVANAEYSHSTPSLSADSHRIHTVDLFLPHVKSVTCLPQIDVQRIFPGNGRKLPLIYFVDIRFRLQRACQNLELCSLGGSVLVCSHTDFLGTQAAGIHISHHRVSALILSPPPRPKSKELGR